MATFISTFKFTEQGIKSVQDTCKRANAFKSAAKKKGAKIVDVYWTLGPFDGMVILDAPDEETATALMLQVGMQGNVRSQTTRAFKAAEMEEILAKVNG